jgi:hypothetical protein
LPRLEAQDPGVFYVEDWDLVEVLRGSVIGGKFMSQVYQNVGQLFGDEQFSEIQESPEWTSAAISEQMAALVELLERRREEIEEGLTANQTRYFLVSSILRQLGYCASASELVPGGSDDDRRRADFVLFSNADEFRSSVEYRAQRSFFSSALGVVRVLSWQQSLDEYDDEESDVASPAYEVDRLVRQTGVHWGILTNGSHWRLFHRDTSGLMTTYYEVDLLSILTEKDAAGFGFFWNIFSISGLFGDETAAPLAEKLLH